MTGLRQSELNSIREVAACHQTVANKLSSFANQVNDSNIKQMFNQASNQARQGAQNLIQML
ncbi:MAG: hypothetical protein FWC91_04585 [Defluviitaleaceae bacterium]|nr:hypothetical protein [Defluviitaleaceae bacterium]